MYYTHRLKLSLLLLLFSSYTQPAQIINWLHDDVATFVKGSYKNFAAVGTCFAVSRYVAYDMSKELHNVQKSALLEHINFLEIGAGTGSLSEVFEQQLENLVKQNVIKSYALVLVELEPIYIETLQKRFGSNPNVKIVCQDIAEWETDNQFDFIVSTLPWNSKFFTNDSVNQIQSKINEILTKHGVYSFVEYSLFGKLSRLIRSNNQIENFALKRQVVENMVEEQGYKHKLIWRNIPVPIHVYYLHKK